MGVKASPRTGRTEDSSLPIGNTVLFAFSLTVNVLAKQRDTNDI